MIVVLDGRISGADGIGRVTDQLHAALACLGRDRGVTVNTVRQVDIPRYSLLEGESLVQAAADHGAGLLHLLDYRSPLCETPIPVIATIHDLLRLNHPQHCYTDEQFTARFGPDGMALLRQATRRLRALTDPPPGARRAPRSWHEEFYALMIAHTAATASLVITPTRTVAADLSAAVANPVTTVVAPWGVDHLPAPDTRQIPDHLRPGNYLLYVGQARSHKGLQNLLAAYRTSIAAQHDMVLALVGRDFTPETATSWGLPDKVRVMGEVSDAVLSTLYAHAAALVHFADHEGFGFPPLESMRLGTRVLVADLPVLRETLGAHAQFTDPAAAAHAIDCLLGEPDTERDRAARRAWAARYRWHGCASTILTCYRQALTRPRPQPRAATAIWRRASPG